MNVIHRNLKSVVSATTDGMVEMRAETADGQPVTIDRLTPQMAELYAAMLTKAAKMARAANEHSPDHAPRTS